MKTEIKKVGDTVFVIMKGKLDYEAQEPLKEDLRRLAAAKKTDQVPKKIIFDFENLEFVGSSGISNFVQTLKDFNSALPNKPSYRNVRSEFRRIMKALDSDNIFDFFEDSERAKKSYDQ